ncbi:MAG: hypothetical protein R2711_01355 [Acidimicrobiales bacterium]
MTRRPLALALLLAASLVLAACGRFVRLPPRPAVERLRRRGDGGAVDDADVEAALERAAPDGTVEVPSEDGATTIAEYAAGSSGYEPANAEELAQLLAVVGTDADGYLTDDAFVVRTTEADAAVLCLTAEGMDIETYRVIPVRPDGTGVDCAA